MKTFKRFTAVMVAVILVLTTVCTFTFSAVAADVTFTDVDASNQYYEAITSLVADGVINGYTEEDGTSTFRPDNTITRAEFSKLLAAASAPSTYSFTETTTSFSDLQKAEDEGGWAIPYVAYAVKSGAVNGYEDGTFKPSNEVTYGEAVKMIVCTLGYAPVIDTTLTPWYKGYIDVATQIGLTKKAITLGDNPAPRGLVAQLIFNMLDCSVLTQTGTDQNGKPVYSTNGFSGSSTSLGDSKDNSKSDDGILLGVFEYCLTGDNLTKSKVLIDDTQYEIGNLDIDDLKADVGCEVKFTYTGSSKKTLSKVTRESGVNKNFKVEDWQISDVTDTDFEYYETQKDKDNDEVATLKFANNFYVVYNGKVVDPSDIDDDFITNYLNVEMGSVTFLSNDNNNNTVEVAFVESYVNYYVNSPSTSNGITTIYDKNTTITGLQAYALDEKKVASVKKVTTKGGTYSDSSLTGITAKSVASIAAPYGTDPDDINIIVSTATVSGTVNQMTSDYDEILIGTAEYEVSSYFEKILEGGADVDFAVGDSGKFYLDYQGKIVYFEKTESSNPYGLLVAYAEGSGVDSSYMLKIMNTSGKFTDYPMKDRVKINGSTYEGEDAINYLKAICPTYNAEKPSYIVQLIRYATSTSNGTTEISTLETVDKDDVTAGKIVPYPIANTVNTEKAPYANGGKLTYTSSGYAFKNGTTNQFTMNSSTVLFIVPFDVTATSNYKKSSYGYFGNGSSFIIEPYDVETGTVAKAAICYLSDGQTSSSDIYTNTSVSFVESVSDAQNSNGENVKKLTYYMAGSTDKRNALCENETEIIDALSALSAGDLIKFTTDNGAITKIKTVYTNGAITNETAAFKAGGNSNYISGTYDTTVDYYQVIRGTVSNIDTESATKTISIIPAMYNEEAFNKDAWQVFNWSDSTVFYKYNTKNKEFEISSNGAVKSYEDFAETDPSAATQVITIVINKKVTAVYLLND